MTLYQTLTIFLLVPISTVCMCAILLGILAIWAYWSGK